MAVRESHGINRYHLFFVPTYNMIYIRYGTGRGEFLIFGIWSLVEGIDHLCIDSGDRDEKYRWFCIGLRKCFDITADA